MAARHALLAAVLVLCGCATLNNPRAARFFDDGEFRVSRPEFIDVSPGYCSVRIERHAYEAVLSVSYEHARMSDAECAAQIEAFDRGERPATAGVRCAIQDAPTCFGVLDSVRGAVARAGTDASVRMAGDQSFAAQSIARAQSFVRLGRFFVHAPVEGERWWCGQVSESGFGLGDFAVQVCRESSARGEDYDVTIYVTPRYVH
jgi:hypothetical protein